MIPLLGFIQNLQEMTNSTFYLPPILITPVFLMPNNDINHFKGDKNIDNNFKNDIDNFIDGNNQDYVDNYRQSLNRGPHNKMPMIGNEDMFRQSMGSSNLTTNKNTTQLSINKIMNTTLLNNSSKDKNDTETINVTTENSLPSVEDHWQNFTVNANLSVTKNESQVSTMNELTTDSSLTDNGPYSAALYDNAFIDQLSITTNSFTNEQSPLPSPKNDRWGTISPMKTPFPANGFKPLAGLYYDGYLHKPLFMVPGFIPKKNYIFK